MRYSPFSSGNWVVAFFLACLPSRAADYKPDHSRNLGFPIYTNHPPGKQITSGQLPATTFALSPQESQKKTHVPPGFEVRLFAAEPEVVNPVAMTWDERGRLWVLELYEYPKGAPKGEPGRDRIKILDDTDADGIADKVTVFADGFSLAEGMALGNGGVYVGAPPNLYFLRDTNGDDKADTREVLLTGFGAEDRHELLNSFAWGPDGWLYMTHGVFTRSKVRDPNDPNDSGVTMDAAVARYHPRTKKFEVFADGTSNPWGVDWNERGDAFVSACVIHHLFHMAPGGQYNRQGGTWANPYGYVGDLPSKGLPAIVDWRHYRAAHAGICVYQGDQYPAEWRGLVFLGNIHQSALNCDRLTPVGATYRAEKESQLLGPSKGDFAVGAGSFLVSTDPWFRPVSVQTGPDGALWVMDWYDKYPCYQNAQADPEGVDREHGRIWRVVWVGDKPGKPMPSRPEVDMDLRKLGDATAVVRLARTNSWISRTAQRLLNERQNHESVEFLQAMLVGRRPAEQRLRALWALHGSGFLDEKTLDTYATQKEPELRLWSARLSGERAATESASSLSRLQNLASDPDVTVRAAVASALRQFTSGSLTVDTKPAAAVSTGQLHPHFKALLSRPSVDGDFYYPHIVWMAMEPRVAQNPGPFLPLLAANDNSVSAYCLRRVMRRICDLNDVAARARYLDAAMNFLGTIAAKTELAGAALDGLIDAFKSKGAPPTINLERIFAKLTANPAIADKARRLATLLGDTTASRALIAKINNTSASLEDRLRGVTAARETKDDAAKTELLKLFKGPLTPALSPSEGEREKIRQALSPSEGEREKIRQALSPSEGEREKMRQALYSAAVQALGVFGGDDIADVITEAWKRFSLPTRRAAADVLVTRSKWARALLAGVDQKIVDLLDISATARRALARSDDKTVVDHADRVLGRYRPTGADKLKLIADKRKVVLGGESDLKAGYEVAKRTCFVCHKLHGEGAEVGPDLTGVGRSTLDALLHNVIDPNEVIGKGYENTEVELKDGRVINGRILEDTATRLKLLASGPIEHVIARSDIVVENGTLKIRTSELSLMPEGLEQMPEADFRNMIWYLLNPPQDDRPWTPALRKELIGDENAGRPKKSATNAVGGPPTAARGPRALPLDLESVALWNPEWKVICPPSEGAPQKLTEYAGRRNVLMTHPLDRARPAALERALDVPPGKRAVLGFFVAADERGDWELRVLADGQRLHQQVVDKSAGRWQRVIVDLSPLAGRRVLVRLENAANHGSREFGYWSDLEVRVAELNAKAP